MGEWLTVVGITGDVEAGGFASRHYPMVYRPFDQARLYHASVQLNVRIDSDRIGALIGAQSVIRQVTGRMSEPLRDNEDDLGTRFVASRFNAIALDVFAVFGLLLTMLGIYGSIAFAVTQRTREIGIRSALGATRTSVLSLIARRGIAVAVIGSLIGAAASFALMRVFTSFVTATSVVNPWIIAASIATVLGVASIATYLPARRAAEVDPIIALRAE